MNFEARDGQRDDRKGRRREGRTKRGKEEGREGGREGRREGEHTRLVCHVGIEGRDIERNVNLDGCRVFKGT